MPIQVVLGGAALIMIIGLPLAFGKMWMVLYFGDPSEVSKLISDFNPVFTLVFHALPFLVVVGAAYKWFREERIAKTSLRIAAIAVLALYVGTNIHTGFLSEALWRMTSDGSTYHRVSREQFHICQEALANGDLDKTTDWADRRSMGKCKYAIPQAEVDAWCMKIFSAKQPFKYLNESVACEDHSQRLAGVARWPAKIVDGLWSK